MNTKRASVLQAASKPMDPMMEAILSALSSSRRLDADVHHPRANRIRGQLRQ
jgi:hypothetical protein